MTKRQKKANSTSSPTLGQSKNVKGIILDAVAIFGENPFRERNLSLEIHKIRPLDFDGARRENVLRGAGYAWTPDLRVLTNSKR